MRGLLSRARRFGFALAAVAGTLLHAATGAAHSDFPGIIQDTFGSSCAPQCTLCHVNPAGGLPVKAADFYVDGMNPSHRGYGVFVSNLKDRGVPSTPTSLNLRDKLKLLQNEPCQKDTTKGSTADMAPCDTDGDGMSDWEELAAQPARDPEVSGVGNGAICPAYGCGASIGTLPRDADANGRAGALMAAFGVALVLARRVRR